MSGVVVGTKFEKSCPRCKKVLGRINKAQLPFPNYICFVYGSPFVKCDKCGEEFIDKFKIEMAVHGNDNTETKLIPLGIRGWLLTVICLAIAIIALIDGLQYGPLDSEVIAPVIFFGVVGILPILMGLFSYNARKEEVRNQTALSIARFSDPTYVDKLKEIGYLPQSFVYHMDISVEEQLALRKHWVDWVQTK